MQQTTQHPVEDGIPAGSGERALSGVERAVVHRMLAVLPGGGTGLAAQLAGARVRDLVGQVDGLPTRSVLTRRHRAELVPLPVRGFLVDEAGVPVGQVLLWADGGRFVGYRHQAVAPGVVPAVLDPEMLDAVPWSEQPLDDTVPAG
ncbi:hypothetical protein [Modestobacter sp. SSW1-42]|uniref:hypothetical protein n=1 Tax=Modestobacter sp. SSW1-42 TaxID=596372 RepID=UPI0039881594